MTAAELTRAVDEYYEEILRYCTYRVRDRSRAEDLTQETFLRFVRYGRERTFLHEKKCRAYLYATASNVCKDYFAAQTITEELTESIPAPDSDTDLSVTIADALDRLPDEQKEAAVLYYYGGFKVREIAQIQNATASAVKSRLKLARDGLRKILKEVLE